MQVCPVQQLPLSTHLAPWIFVLHCPALSVGRGSLEAVSRGGPASGVASRGGVGQAPPMQRLIPLPTGQQRAPAGHSDAVLHEQR